MDTQALTERLKRLDCAAICDVFDSMGLKNQVLSTAIRPRGALAKIAGPAFCIRGASAADGASVAPPAGKAKPGFEIDRAMFEGCVAVIDTGKHTEGAVIGGNVAISYRLHGCVGAVVDGGGRDVPEMDECGFALFASSITPMSAKGRWAFVDYDVPVTITGHVSNAVRVNPGDFILGDAEGVVVIPKAIAAQVIADAEELMAVERTMMALLRDGEDREKVYAENNPRAHIRPAR